MSKSTIALRWMQSIKSKTEQEKRDKVERNISKLKEIKKIITIKISAIVNMYITVGTSKYAGNQLTVINTETAVNSNSKNNNNSNIIEQGNSNDNYLNNYVINGIASKAHDELTRVRHKYVHAVSISNSNIAKSKGCINSKQLKVIHSKVKLKVTDGEIDIIRDQQ
jgi:hypothetical protein